MGMWRIQWSDRDWRIVSSLAELNSTLDVIHATAEASKPCLAQVASPAGDVMIIGLGTQESILTYVPVEKWPSLTSKGNLHRTMKHYFSIWETRNVKCRRDARFHLHSHGALSISFGTPGNSWTKCSGSVTKSRMIFERRSISNVACRMRGGGLLGWLGIPPDRNFDFPSSPDSTLRPMVKQAANRGRTG